MKERKPSLEVPLEFSGISVSRMWRAFRSEYLSFGRSREAFTSFLQEQIWEAEEETVILDGSSRHVTFQEENFPSPQTFYNFFRRGPVEYVSAESQRRRKKPAWQTLAIIFVFLYQRRPADIGRLIALDNGASASRDIVENLDDSFEYFRGIDVFPKEAVLYLQPTAQTKRKLFRFVDFFEGTEIPSLGDKLECVGAIRFSIDKDGDEICNYVRFPAWKSALLAQSKKLEIADAESETFSKDLFDTTEKFIIFGGKDFNARLTERTAEERSRAKPQITNVNRHIVIKQRNRLNDKRGHVFLKVWYMPGWSDSGIFEYMTAYLSDIYFCDPLSMGEYKYAVAFPPSEFESEVLKKICNLSLNNI